MPKFIGRKHELEALKRFLKKKTASLIVVRGRRRIGKSRLIEEFAKPYKFYTFSGIPPTEKTTAQSQRDEFASQLNKQDFPKIKADDWNDLFWILADKVKKSRVVILLDEISWMGSLDPDFLGKLKNAWDLHFKKNPQLFLVLCGSASSWIEKNILGSTGFVGRISFTLTLDELPLKDCKQFWGEKSHLISAMEKLKILSVTGGVPRYLEEIDPRLSAEDNIKHLCFTKGALLVDEFDRIFSSLFLRNSESYKKIVDVLAAGDKEFIEICEALNIELSGRVLEYLEELELSGFVKRDYTWHLKSGEDAKLSKYRLSDNYLRFYLKYIDKYKTKIERDSFNFKSLAALPGWETIIALQFENLVLNNRPYLWQVLGIKSEDIISENPFFQHKTVRQPGCQIDYMIQTRFGSLYVCEIKFSKHPIGYKIIDEIQEKIKKLKRPKGLSCRPILIHVNGVHDSVAESGYFSDIIDFGQALDGE
jgi:hypothetical protein